MSTPSNMISVHLFAVDGGEIAQFALEADWDALMGDVERELVEAQRLCAEVETRYQCEVAFTDFDWTTQSGYFFLR